MKKYILVLIALSTTAIYSQRKPKIKGSKNVIEVTENLPAFNAIELTDDIDITLRKGRSEGYSLSADDNLIDVLKFEVQDSTLVISSFYKITSKKKLDITIDYFEINKINMVAGRIRMEDQIDVEELMVHTSGNAKLELNANASTIDITMMGNSSGDFNLDADDMSIKVSDRIDVRIIAICDTNIIDLQGNATVKMDGNSENFGITQTGSSNLKASKHKAQTVSANLEGSANARVYANELLELSSKGSSKTYLYGNGRIEIQEFLDTSELHKQK